MDLEEMLKHAMSKVESGLTHGYAIPLGALNSTISLSAAEEPGTFRCILRTDGKDPVADVFTKDQMLATILPLLQRNERLVHLQGALLAAQTEKFLRELANS